MSDLSEDRKVAEQIADEIKRIGSDTQTKLKTLEDSFQRDLKSARDLAAETKDYTDASVRAAVDAAIAKFEAYQNATQKKLDEELDGLKVALNRRLTVANNGGPEGEAKARALGSEFKRVRAALRNEGKPGDDFSANEDELKEFADYSKAFRFALLRKDEKRFTGDELKALTTGEDPAGGWLVPPAMLGRTIQRIYETSPLRQLATVIQIGTDRIEYPIDDNEAGA